MREETAQQAWILMGRFRDLDGCDNAYYDTDYECQCVDAPIAVFTDEMAAKKYKIMLISEEDITALEAPLEMWVRDTKLNPHPSTEST